MVLQIFGGIMAAIGVMMIFTHGGMKTEEIAMKQLFFGIFLVAAGLLLIFYSPV